MNTMHFRKDGMYIREKIGAIIISLVDGILRFLYSRGWSPKLKIKI